MGERMARQAILFDRLFQVEEPDAKALVNEVHSPEIDEAVERAVANALGSGMVSASGNRKRFGCSWSPGHVPALHGDLRARAGLLSSQRTADRNLEELASEESEVMSETNDVGAVVGMDGNRRLGK
jgi:hypothetical protein